MCFNKIFYKIRDKAFIRMFDSYFLCLFLAFTLKEQEPNDLWFHPGTASRFCLLEGRYLMVDRPPEAHTDI